MAAEELVLLAQDDKTVILAIIPATTAPSTTTSEAEAGAGATFRLVVEQSHRCGGAEEVDTMEDVARRVPVAELRGADTGAAAVDRAFEELLAGLDHPTLRREVAAEARTAAARVQARCADEGDHLGGVEFRLRIVFIDSEEEEEEPDSEEETGSDLELDEESWSRGNSGRGGDWLHHGHDAAVLGDDDGGGQFSARAYDGALAREGGGPSDGTLLLSGFEARADGPELGDQHELTPRDMQRLVRLAFSGGDVEGDEGYRRAVDGGGEPVSRVARAVMLDQGMRSARPQQPAAAAETRGMPPRMCTGW